MKVISILDYGINNLFSIKNAIDTLGFRSQITNNKKKIINSDGLVFPGVGSFHIGMKNILDKGLDEIIHDFKKTGKPILAICLGFQLLFSRSFEMDIETNGLNLIPGEIIKLPEELVKKVPHIGWNKINNKKKNNYFEDNQAFYFVHSYYANLKDDGFLLTSTIYGQKEFCSSVLNKNILGCQFHPEKSGPNGLKLIYKFFKNV